MEVVILSTMYYFFSTYLYSQPLYDLQDTAFYYFFDGLPDKELPQIQTQPLSVVMMLAVGSLRIFYFTRVRVSVPKSPRILTWLSYFDYRIAIRLFVMAILT